MLGKTKKFTLCSIIIFAALFIYTGSVFALETNYPTIFGLSIDGDSSLPEYAKYFFNIGVLLAGILAVIVVAFGGIYYLVSLGRGKFTDEGKEWIKAGILGLLLIMSAYLIAYTINPALVIFDLKGLAPLTFLANLFETPSPSLPVDIYYEIPIGILTENVVARAVDCYDFDFKGDPIPGEQITVDDGRTLFGPTHLTHDRVDCFLKLSEAIEKKSDLANKLAQEIAKLMATCTCAGNCDTEWNPSCDAEPPCVGQATCKPPDKACCSEETKEKTEHGPVKIDLGNSIEIEYKGLDEFRSNNNYSTIKNIVELQPPAKINNREISVINLGVEACGTCDFNCPICAPGDGDCFVQRQNCKLDEATCRNNQTGCLKQNSPWYNLKLIDQLTYLKGKAEEIKQKVQLDLNNLKKGESDLGKCYLADSYVDFLKTYEKNDKNNKTIVVATTFKDTEAGGAASLINPAKYCEGFQYGNSTCYSQCQKQCPPGTTEAEINCYRGAPDCNNIASFEEKQACLLAQTEYIKKECYDKRTCLANLSPYNNFSECMTGCEVGCFDSCDQKTGADKTQCQRDCNDDSQCLQENEGACVVNYNRLKDCADPTGCITACSGNKDCEKACGTKFDDPDFIKNCAETSAALCTYGSDQNAGYPDCLKSPYSTSGNYSSSFVYENPASQICSNPNKIISAGTTCQSQYPETSKCPSASACPSCPCGIAYKYIEASSSSSGGSSSSGSSGGGECPPGECLGPDGICSPGYCNGYGDSAILNSECICPTAEPGTPECYKPCGTSSSGGGVIRVESEYRVVSAECDKLSYNDDPLTFYCNQTWWKKDETKNQEPLGNSMTCEKEQEIPVGNTVDDAEKWAGSFIDVIEKFVFKADMMIRYLDGIGREKGYCECGSKCGPTEYACQPKCEEGEKEVVDDDGNTSTVKVCNRTDCVGNSCQQMIHLLLGGSTGACQGEGVKKYSDQIKQELVEIKKLMAMPENSRSDILKELEYSRKMVNTCSQNYSKETKILSCTRVEDEIIPPIIGSTESSRAIINNKIATPSYCYGQAAGEVLGTGSKADNWFCCQSK
ncbi:MAG: pilin [bacterium]